MLKLSNEINPQYFHVLIVCNLVRLMGMHQSNCGRITLGMFFDWLQLILLEKHLRVIRAQRATGAIYRGCVILISSWLESSIQALLDPACLLCSMGNMHLKHIHIKQLRPEVH